MPLRPLLMRSSRQILTRLPVLSSLLPLQIRGQTLTQSSLQLLQIRGQILTQLQTQSSLQLLQIRGQILTQQQTLTRAQTLVQLLLRMGR